MNEKQTAELLDGLRTAFLNRANRDGVLSRFWGMVGERTAGQEDAANYAARLGEVLSETLLEETVAVGDGRIRFAEALTGTDPEELLRTVDGTLGQMMRQAYRMVAGEISSGTFDPGLEGPVTVSSLGHVHLGSIGNLALEKIGRKLDLSDF